MPKVLNRIYTNWNWFLCYTVIPAKAGIQFLFHLGVLAKSKSLLLGKIPSLQAHILNTIGMSSGEYGGKGTMVISSGIFDFFDV